MLDKQTFATLLSELAFWYKKELTPLAERVYYKNVCDFTSEQFEKACETAVARCQFMPTPEQLAEFGGGGKMVKILEYWSRIQKGCRQFPAAPNSVKEYDDLISSLNLDSVALKALELVDGLKTLSKIKDEDLRWYRTSFIEFYQLWDSQRDELDRQESLRVLEGMANKPAALPPSTVEPMPMQVNQGIEKLSEALAMPKPEPEVKPKLTAEDYKLANQKLLEEWRRTGVLQESSNDKI